MSWSIMRKAALPSSTTLVASVHDLLDFQNRLRASTALFIMVYWAQCCATSPQTLSTVWSPVSTPMYSGISNSLVVISKPHIPQTSPPPACIRATTPSPTIRPSRAHTLTKLLVTLRPFILCVTRQHTLNTHANTLNALNRRPARRTEQVQADDAIGVDVRVDWYRSDCGCRGRNETDFGGFYSVVVC